METTSQEYKDHLENKYLPGRDKYLQWFFYPKILRQFSKGHIVDLGCGTGEFLRYLKIKNRSFSGIDNNPHLVEKCVKMGFDVVMDDVTQLNNVKAPIDNAVIDNVLEHLEVSQTDSFFKALKAKMNKGGTLVVVVPDKKGYRYDPTHKTFVNKALMQQMCDKYQLNLHSNFLHPFNWKFMGSILYLNMQVFVIKF
ncbi:MAG: class I SAM-dependent methyltransferase [bacterium]|nr:class I SAM-dependent methyltransferase [bacterium]